MEEAETAWLSGRDGWLAGVRQSDPGRFGNPGMRRFHEQTDHLEGGEEKREKRRTRRRKRKRRRISTHT